MTEENIRIQLSSIFKQTFNYNGVVTDDLNAEKVDRWTSLTHNLFIVEIEKYFDFTFTLREVSRFKNIGDIILTIIKHKA